MTTLEQGSGELLIGERPGLRWDSVISSMLLLLVTCWLTAYYLALFAFSLMGTPTIDMIAYRTTFAVVIISFLSALVSLATSRSTVGRNHLLGATQVESHRTKLLIVFSLLLSLLIGASSISGLAAAARSSVLELSDTAFLPTNIMAPSLSKPNSKLDGQAFDIALAALMAKTRLVVNESLISIPDNPDPFSTLNSGITDARATPINEVDPRYVRSVLNGVQADTWSQAAVAVLAGEMKIAGDILELNSQLSTAQVRSIIVGLENDVELETAKLKLLSHKMHHHLTVYSAILYWLSAIAVFSALAVTVIILTASVASVRRIYLL